MQLASVLAVPVSPDSTLITPISAADFDRGASAAWALRNDNPAEALQRARMLLARLPDLPDAPKPNDRPSVRFVLLNVVIWALIRLGRPEEARNEATVAMTAARAVDDMFGFGECHLSLQLAAWLEGNPSLALEHAHEAQKVFQSAPKYHGYARSLNAIGLNLFELGDYPGAAEHLQLGRERARECGARVTELNCLANLGLVYEALGRFAEAAEVLSESLALRKELGEIRGAADTMLSLGEIRRKIGQKAEAKPLFAEAIDIYRRLHDPVCEVQSYLGSARLHLDLARPDIARNQLEQAQTIIRTLGERAVTIEHRLLFADLFRRFPTACRRGAAHAREEALQHLDVARRIAEERRLVRYLPEVHEQLSLLYEASGELALALHHHKEFTRLTREFLTHEANERASRIKALHDVDRAQVTAEVERRRADELTRLNTEITRQKEDLERLGAQLEEKVRAMESAIADRHKMEAERINLERRLMDTQRLESLGVLAGGIAHDFNNLLTIIGGYTELAAADIPQRSPARDALARVLTATRRAAQLCRSMLDYAGQSPIKLADVQLHEIVEESITLSAAPAGKSHPVEVYLPADLPGVRADPAQLRQVLVNVLLNAAEAMGSRDGRLAINAYPITLDAAALDRFSHAPTARPGNFVCVEVQDEGCGMTPEVQARIFDPFFTTKFTGRGLGLPAVLGILRNHDAAIEVQSAVGKGTTFRIYLPVAETPRPAALPPAREAGPTWRGAGSVLIADDEPDVLMIARRMAASLGFTVVTATDGREALEQFVAQPSTFTAAIIDYQMPHLNGTELCDHFRKLRPELPVLLTSGFAERDSIGEMRTEHGVAFLPKPFTLTTFADALHALLGDTPAGSGKTPPAPPSPPKSE